MHYRFTIVAVAIAAACSPLALADESPAYSQCVALIKQQKVSEAEPICAQAAAEPGKSGKLLYADFLTHKEDWNGAIARYTEILHGVDPANFTPVEQVALRNRAMVGFYLGKSEADDDARAFLKLVPNNLDVLRTGAQYARTNGRKLDYLNKLIELEPKVVDNYLTRSYIYSSESKHTDAFADVETALKLEPGSPYALTARAFAWAATGNYEKAEKDHAAVTRKVPKEPDPWVNRAEVLIQLKRYDDAIEMAGKALTVKPGFERALATRAQANLSMGRADAALADISQLESRDYEEIADELGETAEDMIGMYRAVNPQSVVALEQDRATVLSGVARSMHNTCGYFSVPSSPQDEPDNDGLHAYGDCLNSWANTDDDAQMASQLGNDGLAALDRLDKAADWLDVADKVVCSNMPKKAKCIDDALYTRAQATLDVFDNAKVIVHGAEFDRLNRDVASYNGSVSRSNAINNAASFLQGVADALAAQ